MIPSTAERASQFPYPGRLWSLLNMINFVLGSTIQFFKSLEAETLRFKSRCVSGSVSERIDETDSNRLSIAAKAVHQCFDELGDPHIASHVKDLEHLITKKASNIDVFTNLSALSEAIHIALSQRIYYAYPTHKAAIFYEWKNEWEPIYSVFDEALLDIWHGVDCWAMGQETASVFHMMRVLEFGLNWLAKDVGVSVGIENWHNVIDQIEKRIREIAETLPRGAEKSVRLQFLSEAAKEFRYFKDGWRNYVSHSRGVYDEHQARSVLEHVKSFMLSISKVAKESSS